MSVKDLAEREGFEPSRRVLIPPTRFPVALLRPLGHLSKLSIPSSVSTTIIILRICSIVNRQMKIFLFQILLQGMPRKRSKRSHKIIGIEKNPAISRKKRQ